MIRLDKHQSIGQCIKRIEKNMDSKVSALYYSYAPSWKSEGNPFDLSKVLITGPILLPWFLTDSSRLKMENQY